jgi:hypothetical protein
MGKRYVYKPNHPRANERGFVDYAFIGSDSEEARNAPIMLDRFYENTTATDGTDIGSRKKHRDYMRRMGVTHSSDFSSKWYENLRKDRERRDKEERREAVARATYEVLERRK